MPSPTSFGSACPISSRIRTESLCSAAMPSSPLLVALQLRTNSRRPQTLAPQQSMVVFPDDVEPTECTPPPSASITSSNGAANEMLVAKTRRELPLQSDPTLIIQSSTVPFTLK